MSSTEKQQSDEAATTNKNSNTTPAVNAENNAKELNTASMTRSEDVCFSVPPPPKTLKLEPASDAVAMDSSKTPYDTFAVKRYEHVGDSLQGWTHGNGCIVVSVSKGVHYFNDAYLEVDLFDDSSVRLKVLRSNIFNERDSTMTSDNQLLFSVTAHEQIRGHGSLQSPIVFSDGEGGPAAPVSRATPTTPLTTVVPSVSVSPPTADYKHNTTQSPVIDMQTAVWKKTIYGINNMVDLGSDTGLDDGEEPDVDSNAMTRTRTAPHNVALGAGSAVSQSGGCGKNSQGCVRNMLGGHCNGH